MTALEVQGLKASWGHRRVVHGVDLRLPTEGVHAVLGPSGCGKSTLLRCIAGLKRPDEGRVLLDGRDLTDVPPERRRIVLLHQENTLFPHLSVLENVLFGPRVQRRYGPATRRRAEDLLELVRLGGFGARRAAQLSGGEAQRVALARALAADPQVILLDEPLSHLDHPLRVALRSDIRRILQGIGATALHVTHDREEAFAVADRLLLMQDGRLVDDGTPQRVHDRPASPLAARLLGHHNLLPYRRMGADAATALGPVATGTEAGSGTALYREEHLRVALHGPGPSVRVESWEYVGGSYRVAVRLGTKVLWTVQKDVEGLAVGTEARLDASRAQPLSWPAPDGPEADTI